LAGHLPAGADVENALLYNLDGQGVFGGSMTNGVSFEVDPVSPPVGVRYAYEMVPAESAFRHWKPDRPLASVIVELGAATPTLASIWWSLRSTPGAIEAADASRLQGGPVAITLNVQGPATSMTPGMLKCIIDGIVSGLQSQSDLAGAEALAPLIARTIGAPVAAVIVALTDATPSSIGARQRLVHARGAGVQWTPDDDRCVAARVLTHRTCRRCARTTQVIWAGRWS
jgi:hypothetical protein